MEGEEEVFHFDNESEDGACAEDDHDDIDEGSDDDEETEEGEEDMNFGAQNPLDFIEDGSGVQVYQRLEQYEELAERKREELAMQGGGGKRPRIEDDSAEMIDELMESMNYGGRRRRKARRKGRRKGTRKMANPEAAKILGDANVLYALGDYDQAIRLLKEVIRIAPNMSEPYHTLGLIYKNKGEQKKSTDFYMLASMTSPKDLNLWKYLISRSLEQKNYGQARYCLAKAMSADPSDISLKFHNAILHKELGNFDKAAKSYVEISKLRPKSIGPLKEGAKLYLKCGEAEKSISILENYLNDHPSDRNLNVFELLLSICIQNKQHDRAILNIAHARRTCCFGNELPLSLVVREGICHLHLGDMEKAKMLFDDLGKNGVIKDADLVLEVADAFVSLGHHETALKYLLMLEEHAGDDTGHLYLRVARCYESLGEKSNAIAFFYKALEILQDHIESRLALASLLIDESRVDDAILLLSPPKNHEPDANSKDRCDKSCPNEVNCWWLHEEIKLKLSYIYRDRSMHAEFIDAILSLVQESLFIETLKHKVKAKKRLSRSTLFDRAKLLDDGQTGNVFQGFRPMAPTSTVAKASRAKRSLRKRETLMEEKKAMAIAAGIDWRSDNSDDESPQQEIKVAPLPNLLQDEEHHRLIIDLCKALVVMERYWEALEIINLTLRLANNWLSIQQKEELRTLGAEIEYNITGPRSGFECVKFIVQQHPHSIGAWNRFYKVMLNSEKKKRKFLHRMRMKLKECVPPMIINGHHFSTINQHQVAAKEYLEAYKLMPENPLINLCVGSALINLTLGFRLQNKHQCLAQGLAFLYQNLLLCKNNQEAMYNIARAFHHVGLVSLAASYYEKVLRTHEKDYPIPKLANKGSDSAESHKPGYCDLRREAAHNLHLIYKKSGASDLARQVLRDHCSF